MMTSPAHPSGTDRIAEGAAKVPAAIYLNVQGDLPFINPDDLDALAVPMRADGDIAMATLATPIVDAEEWHNPNVVKVVCDARGDALYFSRAPIPWPREGAAPPAQARRHIGVYAYRRDFLLRFAEPNLHARLLSRCVVGNVVADFESITRNFPEGLGTIEMLCIYQVEGGRIQKASFVVGEKRLVAISGDAS